MIHAIEGSDPGAAAGRGPERGFGDGPRPELRVEKTPSELWRAAAREITATARSAVAERGRFSIALSGGSTPRSLYELLATDPAFREAIPWQATDVFWGDERHVPSDHAESNYRMAREALLSRVPVPEGNVHRVPAELPDPREAAAAYEREIREHFHLERPAVGRETRNPPPVGTQDGGSGGRRDGQAAALPRFDLVLLGLGRDGHTASLFPGSPVLGDRELLVAAARSDPEDTWRITLTLPVLNAGRRVLFLVAGQDKAEAVRRSLRGAGEGEPTPAALVRPRSGRLLWMLDDAAASLL